MKLTAGRARDGEVYVKGFSRWSTASLAALVILAGLLLKLPSLRNNHFEADEQIYLWVADNWRATGAYTLRGTPVLPTLSPEIYDRPLFHHPPLFIILIMPLVHLFYDGAAVLVSWLGHVLCAVAVFIVARRLARDGPRGAVLLPVFAVMVDPLLIFTAQKIWLESLLAGLSALCLAFLLLGMTGDRRRLWFFASGTAWGLAILTKTTAVVLAPLVVAALARERLAGRKDGLLRDAGLLAAPAVVLTLPWFLLFHRAYGGLFPDWIKPDRWMLEHIPFMRMVVDRPAGYFFTELAFINPLVAVTVVLQAAQRRMPRWPEALLWAWFLVILGAFTALGMSGRSFQMRLITMAVVPISMLLGPLLAGLRGRASTIALAAVGAALIYNAATGIWYTFTPGDADAVSLVELLIEHARGG